MIKKINKIFLFLCLCFALTGCIDKEIEDYAIVCGMGIDYVDNQYEVTLEIMSEQEGKTTKIESIVISNKHEKLGMALSNIQFFFPTEMFYNHCSIIIFGDTLAKEGLKDALDFFSNYRWVRSSLFVVIAKEKSAKEILEFKDDNYETVSLSIVEELYKEPNIIGIWSIGKFHHAINIIGTNKASLVLPSVNLENKRLYIDGGVVFDGYRIKDYLNIIDIAVMQFSWGFSARGEIFFDDVYVKVIYFTSHLDYKDSEITIRLNLELTFIEDPEISFNDNVAFEKMRLKLQKGFQDKIEEVVVKYQKKNLDPIGIEYYLYRHHGKKYRELEKDFNDFFQTISIKADVAVDIKTSGVSQYGKRG